MNKIIESEAAGTIKFYRFEDGWGFIEREGAEDEFFHARNLQCSHPYEGENVVFEIVKSGSSTHEHEAMNVRRPQSQRRTGDVLEWHVEPGSWRTQGLLAPHDGGKPLAFSVRDFKPDPTKGSHKARPWHAATFTVVEAKIGPRAVDIDLDTRYPLQRFAYLGKEDEVVQALNEMTLTENWDYRRSSGSKESPILYNYLHFTFARLCDEDRGIPPNQKKVRLRLDLTSPLAAFDTGLVDQKYKSIYALFDANEPGHPQKWKFRAFCIPGEGHGKLLASYFNPLPKPAQYFGSTTELLYDPDAPLHPDYTHILTQNRDRLPKELLDRVKDLDDTTAIRTLTMHLDEAIDVAKKRARWNYRTAVPNYFPSFKRLEFLLPLCLLRDNQVDVALAVQKTETGYLGHTVLPLDWAYKSARLVCRPDSDWLSPEQIDETPLGAALEDVE